MSAAGRCRRCCDRRPGRHSWVARRSGRSWSARGARRARGHGRWCWCPASPGSGRAAWRRSRPMARTARGSPCCGERAQRSWRCRTSHGSRCARSWRSTHLHSSSSGMSSGTAASLRVWRASCRGGCPTCRSRRARIRRPNDSSSSRQSPGRSWSWRHRCPCASCSTICTGRTANRWRC